MEWVINDLGKRLCVRTLDDHTTCYGQIKLNANRMYCPSCGAHKEFDANGQIRVITPTEIEVTHNSRTLN